MAERVLQGQPDIVLTLRRSARARRLTLRISSLDGRVTLTLPQHVPEHEALAFAREKEAWIRKHLSDRVEDVAVRVGISLPVEGAAFEIVPGRGRTVRLSEGALEVPGTPEAAPRRVQAFLKARARDVLAAACDDYAGRLGRPYSGLSLRDTRSRWGSCSSAGRLMFSWRLILAPPQVLRYVAAHEVAHLAQMNHSPAFWAEVTRIHGPYDAERKWLRTQGNALHRYRFGN
ncbi:M48 family metallopeptidase [uncultured Tateyamaria sp.]|uniref:M48 family metallopeptidase n=1 Tax=uncultured Tateyamaria sp. TaxID=455651 RepID=UPI0026265FEA|nr:SprT family zinc-dependent metalloprotease [uncultured Tateyamaria sp.]